MVATFSLGDRFSGAPSYVHGGVTLAVLDEAMAWAAIAIGGKFAVTAETTTRFLRPVLVGKTYRVEARLTSQTAEQIETIALKKSRLDAHYAMQSVLKFWLFFHVPAAVLLVLLACWHLLVVNIYSR